MSNVPSAVAKTGSYIPQIIHISGLMDSFISMMKLSILIIFIMVHCTPFK